MSCLDMKSIEIFVDPSCETFMDPEGQAKFFEEMPPGFGVQGCTPFELPGAPPGPDGKPMQVFIGNVCEKDSLIGGAYMDPKCSMPMEGAPVYNIPFENGEAKCWSPDGKIFLNLKATGWSGSEGAADDGKSADGFTMDSTTGTTVDTTTTDVTTTDATTEEKPAEMWDYE